MFLALALLAWGLRRCAAILPFFGEGFPMVNIRLCFRGTGKALDGIGILRVSCYLRTYSLLTDYITSQLFLLSTLLKYLKEPMTGGRSMWGSWVHLSVVWTISSGAITFGGYLEISRSLRLGDDRKFSIFFKGIVAPLKSESIFSFWASGIFTDDTFVIYMTMVLDISLGFRGSEISCLTRLLSRDDCAS